MTYRYVNSLAPSYLNDKFSKRSSINNRLTRSQDKVQIPLYKTAPGQRSFPCRAVKLWDHLDENIKQATSLSHFKKLMKNYLLNNFINS